MSTSPQENREMSPNEQVGMMFNGASQGLFRLGHISHQIVSSITGALKSFYLEDTEVDTKEGLPLLGKKTRAKQAIRKSEYYEPNQ